MSRTSPLGPWEAPEDDIISCTNYEEGVFGPGHGYVFNPKCSAEWYFVYLEFGRARTNRQIYANKMNFNADGTIQPVQLNLKGVGATRPDPANGNGNLALGQNATASSTRSDYKVPHIAEPRLNRIESYAPGNAVDGSNGSRWIAGDGNADFWLMLDLGEAREINRTELYFVKPSTGHSYVLECSLDGVTWQVYGCQEDVVVKSPHTYVKSAHARYLKVTILNGTPGLWEFRVY